MSRPAAAINFDSLQLIGIASYYFMQHERGMVSVQLTGMQKVPDLLVRTEGLEPSREISQGILSPLRLPFRHVRVANFTHPPARGG
jgi:hypothetical protein